MRAGVTGPGAATRHRDIVRDAPFALRRRRWVTPAIVALELVPLARRVTFVAGQYVQLCDPDYSLPQRSYSVANAPRADGHLQLLVTAVPDGPVSGWLASGLAIGEEVLVAGPYGTFTLPPVAGQPVLALAGGSGWAPLRALAEQAAQSAFSAPFEMLFSARTPADVLDADRVAQWQRVHRHFCYRRTLTRSGGEPPLGRIPQILPALYPDLCGMDVYIAGPPSLVAACTRTVRGLGATLGRVHTEEFYSDPEPW